MSNDLKLRVLFDFVDKVTKPLKNVLAGNKDLARSVKATRDQLKELGKTQKDVATFREMRTGLSATSTELQAAQAKVKALADSMKASATPTKAMTRDFEKAKLAATKLKESQQQQSTQLNELRTRLGGAGVETRNLVQHERQLRTSITATTAALAQQQAKLAEVAARERKLGEARGRMNAMQGTAANMAIGGYAARGVGMKVMGDLKDTVGEARKYETDAERIKALGLGDHASADAIKFSRAMKMYGTSATDNISMIRDAMTVFADEHHAQMVLPTLSKMKFANEAMFGAEDAHANEEKFMNMLKVIELRGGTSSEARFKDEANMVQKVLTATGGRVGADEWKNFIQTGGVAAKQMRKDAFFFQMEPLIQEMGGHGVGTGLMSAYSGIYQGKTTVRAAKQMMQLGLLDPKKVEYNKIGMIKQIRPGALDRGDLFKASPLEWLEKVMLPKFAAKGITDPDKVKDMIATIFSNRTASNLFTTMYMQRAQIHKNERLNQGAEGIDQLAARGQQMTSGREVEAMAKIRDLKLELGERVIPLYNSALLASAKALDMVLGFMREHSTAAKVIITTLTVLAGLLVVAGSLTIALAGVLGPLAILKFSMTTLGMQGGILARVLGAGAGALRMVGAAIMFVGRALLMNPIGAIITAIAVAAYLIYQYWEPIKAFFGNLWEGVKGIFTGAMDWFSALPARFATFGTHMLQGLVDGITNGLGTVKDAITNVASSTVAWFKDKLGINSPSRVFGELGGFISQGAALGIENQQVRVVRAAVNLAAAATTAFMPAAAQPVQLPSITRSAPIMSAAQGAAAPAPAGGAPIINIYAQPGMDPAAIARAVSAELDRRERDKKARTGSRLSD